MTMQSGTSMDMNDLHDATLERIELLWEQKICRCYVRTLSEGISGTILLEFSGITGMSIPRQEPWGPSVSILEIKQEGSRYTIAMQSGDLIAVDADGFCLDKVQRCL